MVFGMKGSSSIINHHFDIIISKLTNLKDNLDCKLLDTDWEWV